MRAQAFGRDELRARVADALEAPGGRAQLVGPPGIGKTCIARAVAVGWPGRVVWVGLEGCGTVEAVSEAVARAADVVPDPADAPFVASLRGAAAPLLVLDGAEDASDLLPDRLRAWFGPSDGPRVLLTTRQRLPLLSAEVEVGPLSVDDGTAVFVHLARTTGVGEVPEDAVRALVERLDGVPLAIELAVGRLRLYSPEELTDRYRLDLLSDRLRGARHGSLRRALLGSWMRLSEEARDALARLSVFDTPFGRRGFLAVAGADLEVLEELLDSSLVHWSVDADGRREFRLLGPVRELAAEFLEDAEGVRLARDRWLLEAAEGAWTRQPPSWSTLQQVRPALVRLASQRDDGVSAARAARSLGHLTRTVGPMGLLTRAVDGLDLSGVPEALRQDVAALVVEQCIREGRHEEAATWAQQLVADDPRTGLVQAELAYAASDLDRVEALLRGLSGLPADLGHRARTLAGATLLRRGQADAGIAVLRDVAETPDPEARGVALRYLAMALHHLGRSEEGLEALAVAIEGHRAAGQRRLEALCEVMAALLLADTDPAESLARAARARAACLALGELSQVRGIDLDCALVLLGEGRAEEAAASLAPYPTPGMHPAHVERLRLIRVLVEHVAGRLDAAFEGYRALPEPGDAVLATMRRAFLAVALRDAAGLGDHELERLARAGLEGALTAEERASARRRVVPRLMLRVLEAGATLRVHDEGRRVDVPGRAPVDLSRRPTLARVLWALHEAEAPLTVAELLARAWGPDVPLDRGRSRVHVALSHLRRLGLEGWIRTHMGEGGPRYDLRR